MIQPILGDGAKAMMTLETYFGRFPRTLEFPSHMRAGFVKEMEAFAAYFHSAWAFSHLCHSLLP